MYFVIKRNEKIVGLCKKELAELSCQKPHNTSIYTEACLQLGLSNLETRHRKICEKLFTAIKKENHKLHHLLPPKQYSRYNLRNKFEYPLPKCRTKRYKDSFEPWCIFNLQ